MDIVDSIVRYFSSYHLIFLFLISEIELSQIKMRCNTISKKKPSMKHKDLSLDL